MKETGEKKPSSEKDNSLSGKKIVISGIDIKEEDILQYDRKGATLVFDTSATSFPILSEETIRQMSKWNADRYRICKEIWEELKTKDPVREVLDGIEFGPNKGSAQDRLKIERRNKEFVYWWEIPSRVYEKQAQGWQVVQGSTERTIHSDGSRIHRIGKRGEEELILLRLPKEKWKRYQKEKVERYLKGTRGIGAASADSLGQDAKNLIEDEQLQELVSSGKVKFRPIQAEGSGETEE